MNESEMARFLCLKESTLRKNFPRTKENFLERGILLMKEGRGDAIDYDWEDVVPGSMEKYLKKKYHRS